MRRRPEITRGRHVAAALALAVAAGLAPGAARAGLITFEWSDPNPRVVGPGTLEVSVDLVAFQSGGADTASVAVAFALSGNVVDLALSAFGPEVSEPDSVFGIIAGEILVIAVAPAQPGSFGMDTDFTVASLTLTLDEGFGDAGIVTLLDVRDLAGAPALESDGVTEVPSDLSSQMIVTLSEPEAGPMVPAVLAIVGHVLRRRRGRLRNAIPRPPGPARAGALSPARERR